MLLTSGLILTYAQNTDTLKHHTKEAEIIINHRMIERFNAIEYDSTMLSYRDLIEHYSLDEVKLIYHAYHAEDFHYADKQQVDCKLAELKVKMGKDIHRMESPDSLLTDNTDAQ